MQSFAEPQRTTPAAGKTQPAPKPHTQRHRIAQAMGYPGLQPKLRLGARNDPLEREADQTAARIVGQPAPTYSDAGRATGTPPAITEIETSEPSVPEEEPGLEEPEWVGTELATRIERLNAHGRPLPDAVRGFMEPRFGRDFSRVRIHTGEEAAQLSEQLNAHAFTLGEQIVFGRGAYQPETRAGKVLLAHELTHVVQQRQAPEAPLQRWYIPGVSEVAEFVEDAVDSAGNFLASKGWALVRRYAPSLEPILRQGPLNWLKEKIGEAFDGIVDTLNRLNPSATLERMSTLFSELLSRAGTIIEALMSGDCGPLFQAIRQLKGFVTEVAGNAWDKLTEFLTPIGDFFADLWQSTGARAIDWLGEFAGDLWQSIRDFGQQIWDWSQPIRDALQSAWDWVKEKLFGPEDQSTSDSQGGIISWITDKAGEAWDWVKERTRPVWRPIQQGLVWLRELIPPAFVRNLGENMSELSQSLGQAEQQMGAEGGEEGAEQGAGAQVATNRRAIAAALPSLQQVLSRVRQFLITSGDWLTEKVVGLRDKIGEFFSRLRQQSLTQHLAGMLGWLERGANALGRWAQQSVANLFNRLVSGFDRLTPFIERVAGVARRLISAAGDLMQLPQLILSSVWNLIPACIRNPIKDFLVNQILARIPVFGQLVQIRDLWQRVQATAMQILRQVFVDGNIAGAAWTFFQAMLRLIGLPPQLVVQVLARAVGAMGHILSDPIGFITNALKAIWQGFSQFFGNIGRHLVSGISGWLFGQMRGAGITPPEDFSLRSMLGVVMQILDITRERIFERLGRRIGRPTVERLQSMLERATGVWQFIHTLVREGPGALWQELQQRLSDLGNQLMDSIVGWVTRTIINRVSARLLTMLDPSGIMAVVNALVTLYQTIESFMQHLREMLEIVNNVLQGINGIATGAIEQAANFLEGAMGRSIPVILGFLANYAGLGNLSERIREMVQGIRARVDAAIDWLIDRAIRLGQGLINLARRGASAVRRGVRRGVAAVRDWWRARTEFRTDGGERHSLYVEGRGSSARLMIASTPTNYREYIENLDTDESKSAALRKADELDRAIADAATSDNRNNGENDTVDTNHAEVIANHLDELSQLTQPLLSATENRPSTPPVYGSLSHGFGTSVSVERLTPNHGSGGSPTVGGGHWEALSKRKTTDGRPYYVRGHLLNEELGGVGDHWKNLTPLTQGANLLASGSMYRTFEKPVQTKVDEDKKTVNYVVTANYGYSHPLITSAENRRTEEGDTDDDVIADIIHAEQYVPRSLNCASYELKDDGTKEQVAVVPIANTIEASSLDDYELTGSRRTRTRLYIDQEAKTGKEADRDGNTEEKQTRISNLRQLEGIDTDLAQSIIDNRPDGGYRSSVTLKRESGMTDSQWDQARDSDGFRVHIYQRGS